MASGTNPHAAACLQYGHTALRWLPLHGPLPRRHRTHRPYILACLDCGETIRRTRAHPTSF